MNRKFFDLSIRQPVNIWLCISLVFAWTLWVSVYYVKSEASIIVGQSQDNNAGIASQLSK